jgi:hypothetical protein
MKRLIAALVLASCAMPTLANIATIKNATINRILIQEGLYGGCMIQIDQNIADAGLVCPANNWVSFDCEGFYGSKASAQRAFDSVQMAFALQKKVSLYVDDSKTHNVNFCVAVRIDVLN